MSVQSPDFLLEARVLQLELEGSLAPRPRSRRIAEGREEQPPPREHRPEASLAPERHPRRPYPFRAQPEVPQGLKSPGEFPKRPFKGPLIEGLLPR